MRHHELSSTWNDMHDVREAEQAATEQERSEDRRMSRFEHTPQHQMDRLLESTDQGRGRSGLHVKHGVFAEDMPNGNWSAGQLLAAERRQGTLRTVGIGSTVCPVSAESIFDCELDGCDHPAPGEVVR